MSGVLFSAFGIAVTGWKLVGFAGVCCFSGRWLVQFVYRVRTGSAALPTLFWAMSALGAALLTLYFVFGQNDSIGILQNAIPLGLALFNLRRDLAQSGTAAA